ncbi:hypothetical protein CPT_Maja_021 [Burkholderia phage Maja]|uniref:Uncharacterized protein n=1 Tax=Burkholderia phage Maja TaxID=2767571 RepID=A0A7S6U352_9CAUD|nr:hypothetical protein CPT_Maja_021 [Burkholderia phage Maja]
MSAIYQQFAGGVLMSVDTGKHHGKEAIGEVPLDKKLESEEGSAPVDPNAGNKGDDGDGTEAETTKATKATTKTTAAKE